MKCSEAVEWMHRYIDHDLDDDESTALFEHMRGCRECEEQFSLLTELSDRLDKLPMVTPPYSLVDAILPQLEALDLGRREGGSALEEIVPQPATMAPSTMNRRREPSSAGRRRAYRTGALGLAAALILGVFIYQVEPRSVRDAEVALQSAADKSNSAANSTAKDEALKDHSTANTTDGNSKVSSADNMGAAESSDAPAAAAEAPVMENGMPSEAVNKGGDMPDSDDKPAADGSQRQAEQQPGSSAPASGQKPSATQQNSGEQEVGIASVPEDNSVNDAAQSESPKAAANGGNAADTPIKRNIAESPEHKSEPSGMMMGIAGFGPVNEWPSPDGEFLVKYADGHLLLLRNDSSGTTLVTDVPVDGNWQDGKWSEDGTIFNYVVEKDGVSVSHSLQPVR